MAVFLSDVSESFRHFLQRVTPFDDGSYLSGFNQLPQATRSSLFDVARNGSIFLFHDYGEA